MNVLHFLLPFCCSAMKARCSTSGRVQGGVRRKKKWRSGVVAHLHGGYTYVTSPRTAILRSMTMINLTIPQQRHLTKKIHHQPTRAYKYLKRGLGNVPKTQRTSPTIHVSYIREKQNKNPRKAIHKPSDPATCMLHPIAVCVDAVVTARLVVSVAAAILLLLLPSIVTIFDEICTIVLMLCSFEAEPDEPPGSLSPVKYFIDMVLRPKSLVTVHDAKLADLLCVEESRSASRVVDTATSRLPWPHGSYGKSPLSATLV